MFRLVWWNTQEQDKYITGRDIQHEFLGALGSIWNLWFTLKEFGYNHIEIYNLDGQLQDPKRGVDGLSGHIGDL